MMRGSTAAAVWAVALAEMRSARRQVRTWAFSLLAVGGSLVFFVGSSAQHAQDGWISPVTDFPAPRFAMSSMGMLLLLAFLFGVIFLAFDVRARDRRERMAEVLDTRPFSNVALLLGRVLGVVGIAFLAALTLVVVVQTLGSVGGALGAPTEPVQLTSLATFLFIDALPMLLAWVSVVVLLTVVLRNRLLVAVAALGLLAAWVLWSESQPLHLSSLVGPSIGNLASDILPRIAEPATALHRQALAVAAVGVLYGAAALHPRLDNRRQPLRLAVSGALIGVGAATMAGLYMDAKNGVEIRELWLAVHRNASTADVADVEHIAGRVRIDPGRELAIDVVMRLVASAESRAGGEVVMSFNPGMTVRDVRIDGEPVVAVHRDGLLRFEPPATAGGFELELRADGVPDPAFAYLDGAFDFATDSTGRRNAMRFLGRDASIFDADYVALMPGVHWLPRPGANVGVEDPGRVARDFHTLDLAVEVPAGWLVAGPGRRRAAGEGEFRFDPGAPVPEVALIASRFERRATEVAGVELELLMSAGHLDSLAAFEDAVEPLRSRLGVLFGEATSAGLDYPYGGLSVVEVPATLRRCGGGWRMDTVQALPGMLLLNERGFPTARFDFAFRRAKNRAGGGDGEEFKIKALERYFRNDYAGGDPFAGLERNLMRFQAGVAERGMAATALEFVVEELVNRVMSGREGFFSSHVFTPDGVTSLGRIALSTSKAFGGEGVRGIRDAAVNRPVVWDLALATSLAALDPGVDPGDVLDVLALRGGAVARSVFDALGQERTGALLRELRRRGSYDVDAFYEAAVLAGADLKPLLGDWLNDAGLPGFVASSARSSRLADTARGGPRYETRVQIRNDESVPGLVRLRYVTARWQKMKGPGMLFSEPVRVAGESAMEISLVTASPITRVWMDPYLSLNRGEVQLAVETADESAAEGFTGARPSDWHPPTEPGIVVDDLDAQFVVERAARRSGLRIGGLDLRPSRLTGEMDQGLPDYLSSMALNGRAVRFDGEWRRQQLPSSWGRYRRTLARAGAAGGHARAVFSTELPVAGEWRLDYHMPLVYPSPKGMRRFRDRPRGMLATLGEYDMVLQFGDGEERTVAYDASGAENGWNDLGRFALPEGSVRLVVSNRTSGDFVLADAVRWRPVGPGLVRNAPSQGAADMAMVPNQE